MYSRLDVHLKHRWWGKEPSVCRWDRSRLIFSLFLLQIVYGVQRTGLHVLVALRNNKKRPVSDGCQKKCRASPDCFTPFDTWATRSKDPFRSTGWRGITARPQASCVLRHPSARLLVSVKLTISPHHLLQAAPCHLETSMENN